MLIEFPGKVTLFTANLVKGDAKVRVESKLDEIDEDTIKRLSEICGMQIGVSARIEATSNRKKAEFPCWLNTVLGNFPEHKFTVVLSALRRDILVTDEAMLVEISQNEWPVSVEITSRQMSFSELSVKLEKVQP